MQEFFGAKNQLNFMVNYARFYIYIVQKIWLLIVFCKYFYSRII